MGFGGGCGVTVGVSVNFEWMGCWMFWESFFFLSWCDVFVRGIYVSMWEQENLLYLFG